MRYGRQSACKLPLDSDLTTRCTRNLRDGPGPPGDIGRHPVMFEISRRLRCHSPGRTAPRRQRADWPAAAILRKLVAPAVSPGKRHRGDHTPAPSARPDCPAAQTTEVPHRQLRGANGSCRAKDRRIRLVRREARNRLPKWRM